MTTAKSFVGPSGVKLVDERESIKRVWVGHQTTTVHSEAGKGQGRVDLSALDKDRRRRRKRKRKRKRLDRAVMAELLPRIGGFCFIVYIVLLGG